MYQPSQTAAIHFTLDYSTATNLPMSAIAAPPAYVQEIISHGTLKEDEPHARGDTVGISTNRSEGGTRDTAVFRTDFDFSA